jgi:hypothetical protein
MQDQCFQLGSLGQLAVFSAAIAREGSENAGGKTF